MATVPEVGRFLLLSHRPSTRRLWEVDVARGLAILLMVIYHFVFDLTFFGYYGVNVFTGGWRVFGRTPAVLFLLVVGVSLAIDAGRAQGHGRPLPARGITIRGLKIFGWGLVITLVSWLYLGEPAIVFGILHLIGASTVLAIPFLSKRQPALWFLLAAVVLVTGISINPFPAPRPWMMVLGFAPTALPPQLDYFPLLPWFGLVLMGVVLGQWLFPLGHRRFPLPEWGTVFGMRHLAWMGQRSLLIYLLHQPVLILLLSIAHAIRP